MSLQPGTHLGPYEILSAIGAGGMGEVYRARDTRLKRDVALKILPDSFAADPDRVARFQREAEVLASLNHPNIAHIHGLEEGGNVHALVMELVEGEELSQRIARGPIPIDEALPIAKQIAEALEAAHELGIVHRDLKPANIKITPNGVVKVLDFGLAKALEPQPAAFDASHSPTIASATMMSGVGVLLGTAAYMSPEQARGKSVDRRADVWAFGCVLYEMLAGRQAFPNEENVSDTLAGVLKGEPDWQALPAATPPKIRALLEHCLRKDPRHRWSAIAVVRIEIEDARSEPLPAAPSPSVGSRRREIVWAVIALMLLLATAALAMRTLFAPPLEERVVRFDVSPPQGAKFRPGPIGQPLSPDGRKLAFYAVSEGGRELIWVRPLDSSSAQPLPGTERSDSLSIGPANSVVFWSADSKYLAFFADGKLKKVAASGGPPQVICNEARRDVSWSAQGVILIGGNNKPLLRVSSAGGQPVPATELQPNETTHDYPDFLPDGRHFLYMARQGLNIEDWNVYVGSLDSKERHLLPGIHGGARYSSTGHVVFIQDNTLMAQPFDLKRLELSGDAFPIADQIQQGPNPSFSLSLNGTLAYHSLGGAASRESLLAWFDRTGRQLTLVGPKAEYYDLDLSPDGKYAAFDRGTPRDVWVVDIQKNLSTRLTSDRAADVGPTWSPDGHTVAFVSRRDGGGNIYERAFGVVADDKPVLKSEALKETPDWSPDGRYLAYGANGDIWALPLFGDGTPLPVTKTTFFERNPRISPDGHWVAYESDEPGRIEIYAQSFPQPGPKRQVSTTGGFTPRWRVDGKELFYVTPDLKLMAVSINTAGSSLDVGAPTLLFQTQLVGTDRAYSVSPDGRLLMNTSAAEQTFPITVVLNWQEELKRLVPTK